MKKIYLFLILLFIIGFFVGNTVAYYVISFQTMYVLESIDFEQININFDLNESVLVNSIMEQVQECDKQ